jgi:hypothetical protein
VAVLVSAVEAVTGSASDRLIWLGSKLLDLSLTKGVLERKKESAEGSQPCQGPRMFAATPTRRSDMHLCAPASVRTLTAATAMLAVCAIGASQHATAEAEASASIVSGSGQTIIDLNKVTDWQPLAQGR